MSIHSTRQNTPPTQGLGRLLPAVDTSVLRFIDWLAHYGDTSQDIDDLYNSRPSRFAKRIYYDRPTVGKLAVAPLVLVEFFIPAARVFFWRKTRFPIADAHYAMGFSYLFQRTQRAEYYDLAVQYLRSLIASRCPGYEEYGWGYPFDWETVWGRFPEGTPLITTTPYCYEAFSELYRIDSNPRWLEIMHSIAEHALKDYPHTEIEHDVWATSYSPLDHRRVVNASAYRACLLSLAGRDFEDNTYRQAAEQFLNFVLVAQQEDGSWYYAMDGWDKFTDHYHTCFVLKALVKITRCRESRRCSDAIASGIQYYLSELIDESGLPRPFARPPRLVLYRRELYDYAEACNLALLLMDEYVELGNVLTAILEDLFTRWQRKDGAYRTRQLLLGWNSVPMHRWGLAQTFRSLCLLALVGQKSVPNILAAPVKVKD